MPAAEAHMLAERAMRQSEADPETNTQADRMIDDFFASKIAIVEQGVSRQVSAFEAIAEQLWRHAIGGSKRATSVLLQYLAFAARRSGGMGGVIHRVEVLGEDASKEEPRGNNA